MNSFEASLQTTRRHFFAQGGQPARRTALALASAGQGPRRQSRRPPARPASPLEPHFPPQAKHVIYLHMVGGPLADGPVRLQARRWTSGTTRTCPSRSAGPAADHHDLRPGRFPDRAVEVQVSRSTAQCGMWMSELLPWTAKMVDDICFIRSMHTEAINHEPAITFMQTGNQITGRPCLGAWASYGLGSLTTTCRRSWCWWPARPTPSRCRRSRPGSGRAAICRASTPA